FIRDCPKEKIEIKRSIVGISLGDMCTDTTPKPKNIISQGLLVQGGLMLLAGESKVGKSHVLLSMLVNLSAGLPFLGLEPPHPLKIFYLQSENDFFEMRDRGQQLSSSLNPEQLKLSYENLFLTSNYEDSFTESVVDMASQEINKHQHGKTDLIVVDPLYDSFDAGDNKGGENDNQAMLFFLKKRLKVLRQKVNTNAGMILVHHTRKVKSEELEEIRFDAISGASGLRRHYNSAMLYYTNPQKT
ncbi:AAA family ATPase, partial [Candidatus Liberibacter sp.]|uniref:AAA family ATPase n=1 Tax=Candidatus Liberibacter sp. TaxID=34022 RepID=UPI00183EC1AB